MSIDYPVTVHMSELDWIGFSHWSYAKAVAHEERLELLAEVRALEDQVAQRDAELDTVREQLALEISLRTMGGTPAPSTPLWSNSNIKFSGAKPPPYTDKRDVA